MSRTISFAIFITVFLTIYLAGNFYILRRLASLLNIKPGPTFYTALSILTLSFLIAAILENAFENQFTRILYLAAAIWMGTAFLLLCYLLLAEILIPLLKIPHRPAAIAIITLTFITSAYSIYNTARLHIAKIQIPAPTKMTIVQITDLHMGSVNPKYVEKVVNKTNSLNPDLILITGDLFDSKASLKPPFTTLLKTLNAPACFVTGNHERYLGIQKTIAALEKSNITPLYNKKITFKGINIIGITDNPAPSHLQKQLSAIPTDPKDFSILMYHRPKDFEHAASAGIDLMLSGHTHHGQIFPFNYIVQLFFNKTKGLYKQKNAHLYISPGTGTWGPPMRLGSKNQLTLIKLTPKKLQN